MGFRLIDRLLVSGEKGLVDFARVGILGHAVIRAHFGHVRVFQLDELLHNLGGTGPGDGAIARLSFELLCLFIRSSLLGPIVSPCCLALVRLALAIRLGRQSPRLHVGRKDGLLLLVRIKNDDVLLFEWLLALFFFLQDKRLLVKT